MLLAIAAIAVPRILSGIENGGAALDFESAIRVYFAVVIGLALIGSALFYGHRCNPLQVRTWRIFAGTAAFLLLVFALDRQNLLMHEYSWIRYPTAIALILAGSMGLVLAKRSGPRHRIAWAILGSGFMFGGLDEVFQLHEAIPGLIRIENSTIAGVWNDLSTVAFFLIGLVVVFVLWRKLKAAGPEGGFPRWLMRGYWTAVFTFGVSQFFDTADRFFRIGLEYGADGLAAAGHRFPDYWYMFAHPVHMLNTVEEILELTAALMFFACTWHYLRSRSEMQEPEPRQPGKGPRAAYGVVLLVLVIMGWSEATSGSPLTDGREANIEQQTRDKGATLLETGERENLPLRRMFRDLKRTKRENGELLFETGTENGSNIVPRLVWRASGAVTEAGQ
ncbi:MAG: hypothetical protein ACYTGN_09500 [Planctomycetota bacterium]